jgi:flagellar biogenesis protein FliO
MGTMLLAGAATVVIWKIFAAFFFGLLGMALKVALVVGVVYLVMKFFQKKDDEEEE